jgi:hypothetical protein
MKTTVANRTIYHTVNRAFKRPAVQRWTHLRNVDGPHVSVLVTESCSPDRRQSARDEGLVAWRDLKVEGVLLDGWAAFGLNVEARL